MCCWCSYCGDGVRNGSEVCDGAAGPLCYGTGTVSCNADCSANPAASSCKAFCGDNLRNGSEQCDGWDVPQCHNATTPVGCTWDCKIVLQSCTAGYCGDGKKNGVEQCDGADLTKPCPQATCTAYCEIDTTLCP
jgi:hypothetical protein